jgi:hypothetical protein
MTTLTRAVLLSLLIVMLTACTAEPVYTPDVSVLATREAAEYESAVNRGQTAWYVGVVLMVAITGILILFAWQLRAVGYRIQAAKAAAKEAEARRMLLVDLGGGQVLELLPGGAGQGVIHSTTWQAVPEVTPAEPAPKLDRSQRRPPTSLQSFVIEAAAIVGWESTVLPRWDRWQEHGFTITAERWMQATDDLAALGLIVKSQGRATAVRDDNSLVWVYRQLERADLPTEPR